MFRLRLLLTALTLCSVLAAAPAAHAAPGDLDPGFGAGGMARLLESEETSYAEGIAVQPDGKVIVAGEENGSCVVLRLLSNGALDPSFGSGGKVTTTVPGGCEARAAAVQPDGKIVVAGGAQGAVNVDFFIARYNTDGSPDLSFGGGDGIAIVPVGNEEDEAEDVAIGPGGRIVASGTTQLPGFEEAAAVVVLQSDGIPDPSFGGDGSVQKQTPEGSDRGVAVAMPADGDVLLADENGAGGGSGFTLMKLLPSGEYDPSFGGGDGIAFTPIPAVGTPEPLGTGRITDFAVLPDGRIIASGYGLDFFASGANPPTYHGKFAAVRYLPDGELDPSFAEGGIFTRRIADEGTASAVELAQGGGYLFAGTYELPTVEENAAWVGRLKPDGTPDPAFGSGGFVLRNETAPFGESVENTAIDSADRLLTIGAAYGANNTSWTVVTRYLGDPQPTPVVTPTPPPPDRPPHAQMKPIPKKLLVGTLDGFSGTAADADGNGVQSVQIALVKKVVSGGKAKASSRARLRCVALSAKQRFKRVKAKGRQCPQVWVTAKGTSRWSFKLKGELPPGKYVVFARAVDGKGLAETQFSRKLRNRYAFRVLASR
ncbi:MAG: hypothetical protein ACTHKT_01560 [Solirubrobacterales bacterium]